MSESELVGVKCRLIDLLSDLDEQNLNIIEQWISSQSYKADLEKKKSLMKTEKTLVKIGKAIKGMVPFEAEFKSEKIVPPIVGDQADCNEVNCCHVDEFLYDEEAVEQLVKDGKLRKYYCTDCKSRNMQELTYISHSKSRKILQYIFKVLLPNDLENKQVLDVGSRIGAVIFSAYYLTNSSSIIGVEMNQEWCDVQDKIIQKFSMDPNRVKVIHADITDRADIIENSDIIIMNVFDFFVDIKKHQEMWYFFKKHIKKGSYLVLDRRIDETLGYLDLCEEFSDWLSICRPSQLDNELLFDVEDCYELYLYTVV